MLWRLQFTPFSQKQFEKLDPSIQRKIMSYFEKQVLSKPDPLVFCKPLRQGLREFYRFRIEDYRIITSIVRQELVIQVIKVGHRRHVYM